jgi:hypothetical protein
MEPEQRVLLTLSRRGIEKLWQPGQESDETKMWAVDKDTGVPPSGGLPREIEGIEVGRILRQDRAILFGGIHKLLWVGDVPVGAASLVTTFDIIATLA